MIVADLSRRELVRRLSGPGIRLRTGPVVAHIRSGVPSVADGIALHYAQYAADDGEDFADFHVRVDAPFNLRRWLSPQAYFYIDGDAPFAPLPLDQAFPMLEWGLNWCVSAHCHRYLIIHAAVIERSGRALILPAPPGSGKSTLAAALVNRGWRLLADELTLIDFASCSIVPLPRPVSLKNGSIPVIRSFAPGAKLGAPVRDTLKGTVAHMQAPADDVRRAAELASPRWIVFPRYRAGSPAALTAMPKERGFMQMAAQAFNYAVHGRRGFELLAKVIDRCTCHAFEYGDLDEAVASFESLHGDCPGS